MKITAKVLVGMTMAMAVVLGGCKVANTFYGDKIVDYDSKKNAKTNAEVTASVNKTNEGTEYLRGMRLFSNKKKGIVAKLQIQDLKKNTDNPGVVALVFDQTKNKDGTLNFVIVGLKNDVGNGRAKVYISYFRNINTADFNKNNFGADQKPYGTDLSKLTGPVWKDLIKDNDGWVYYDKCKITSDNTLNLGVTIKALKKSEWKNAEGYDDESDTNAYVITFRNADDTDVRKLGNTKGEAIDKIDVEPAIGSFPITHDEINATENKLVEGGMGFYANVYGNTTLKAEWQVADMKHNPNEDMKASPIVFGDDLGIEIK